MYISYYDDDDDDVAVLVCGVTYMNSI